MLPHGSSYEDVRKKFVWQIPEYFNIGVDVCDKWADCDPSRPALIQVTATGPRTISFGDLRDASNRYANVLKAHGIQRGDRVGILLAQSPETAYAHIAAYKLGAIALPLFSLFGEDALRHRLVDAGAKAVITDLDGASKLSPIRNSLPDLCGIFCIDPDTPGTVDLGEHASRCSTAFEPVITMADDPALIIYTSGTTGLPKGALHAHRTLLGHLPGVEMAYDLFPQPGDIIWTPADWAWIGGLLDVLLPALHHGVPVVACRFPKFTGEAAFDLLERQGVTTAFIPPTALKLMRNVEDAGSRWRLKLRSVGSGGETLGAELLDWGRRVLGVTINEFYGQTECNLIVSSSAALGVSRAGCMGRPAIGHDVDVIDAAGQRCEPGMLGDIAVKAPNPVMFLGYWNNPDATAAKFRSDWLITGDRGMRHRDGFIQFVGRNDDIITSSGYRIGPSEIEDCLMSHDAVAMAAVIGKPDAARTEIVKAYVVLRSGLAGNDVLRLELQTFVKTRLAAHEYPREIEFVETLPMTVTGKIIRQALRARAAADSKDS